MDEELKDGRARFALAHGSCTIGRMALDPAHPPIWLRKLHVCAEQIMPDDYAPTPEEGILMGCRLSDAHHEWSLACAQALGLAVLPPRPPFENPFRLDAVAVPGSPKPRADRVIP